MTFTTFAKDDSANQSLELHTTIQSTHLNENRQLKIKLPASYHESEKKNYPVLYVLDGQNMHKNTAFIYDFLSSKRHIPEMIIVSIPHTGRRTRDYNTYFRGSDKVNEGADHFMSFLQYEVIPFVDGHYKTTDYRMLSGHSQSGLFVFHSLIKQPKLFKARFAFSPSLHHIPEQRKLLAEAFERNNTIDGYFYVNVGGTEFFKITEAIAATKKLFEEHAPKGLRFDFDFHEVDGHQSSPFIGQHLAFKRLFAPLRLGNDYEKLTYNAVVDHFDTITTEFGYPVKPTQRELNSMAGYYLNIVPSLPVLKKIGKLMNHYFPEDGPNGNLIFSINWLRVGIHPVDDYLSGPKPSADILNRMGYRYLLDHKTYPEALFLLELATQLYPESSNPFDSYGEALETTGNLKNALKMYKKAYAIEQQKRDKANSDNIDVYLKNINRLEKNGA